jgi:hypothetical protein
VAAAAAALAATVSATAATSSGGDPQALTHAQREPARPRRKLGDPPVITTTPGVGYRITGPPG